MCVCVFQRVLQLGGLTLKHSRSFHHSPVWKSPLIPIVVEQTVSQIKYMELKPWRPKEKGSRLHQCGKKNDFLFCSREEENERMTSILAS